MNWDEVPRALRDRYESISGDRLGGMKLNLLESMNTGKLPTRPDIDTESYALFAEQFNSTLLAAHFFENLMHGEDRRLESTGYDAFQITIPERYFRHPGLDDSMPMGKEEADEIRQAVNETKARLNFSKDMSFVAGQLYKLEFISVFSYLEAYVESLLTEVVGLSKLAAFKMIRDKGLPEVLGFALDQIDPRILRCFALFEEDALKFIAFCHILRNQHVHRLGITTARFYKSYEEGGFLCHDHLADSGEPDTSFARTDFHFCDTIIRVGQPINLSAISRPFRLFVRELATITEHFCQSRRASAAA
ncbi:hypothetical protein ACS0ZG_19085 [Burkholderia gladioli]|uniref:hypothetical protein n=1 Tax=Burkholderia gladioli TaxID=28095 RepID=UPI00064AA3AF|nr:hypothetical protein [Burkholderia gladioli]MDA0572247.1 hypothetical protein [Burkholderia gladioli]MDA0600406.1 hypothetical protein [Burkholderia gladioli]